MTYETEQEILAALSDTSSPFDRSDAINALVNDIGYLSEDAVDLVNEWIEDLDWHDDNYEPPDPPGWEGGFADNH